MSFKSNFIEEYGYEPLYEGEMTGAIKLFFIFGICPGSCTSAIIRGDFESARAHAHSHLKMVEKLPYNNKSNKEPIECLYNTYRAFLGEFVCNYDNWSGINVIPDYEQAMIFLECPHLQNWMQLSQPEFQIA